MIRNQFRIYCHVSLKGRQDGKTDRVREPAASFGLSVDLRSPTVDDVIRRVEEGFDVQVLERFRRLLDISVDAAASLLGTSARTLARRQKEGHPAGDGF